MFLERQFDPGLEVSDVHTMVDGAEGCFSLYRVDWNQSFLAADGKRLVCWLSAPDAESTRQALRQAGVVESAWVGTVHDSAAPDAPSWQEANVLVERSWEEPVTLDEIQAIEDAGAHCLENHRVRFARTFFAADRRRMVCLYQAPDAEAVRAAQRQAGMPVDRVWAFRGVREV